jgi:DNA-binding IclR family transcriptional regulator
MSETNSFERMLAILGLFTEARLEWTPEALMAETGYSRPTLYRYLKTLKDHGFLVGRPRSGFTLGPKLVEMDYLLRRSDPLVLEGREILRQLTGRYPCAAFLARWYGEKVLCMHAEQSATDLTSSYPRGRPMPIGRGAASHSILAFLPRRQLMPLIERRIADFRAVGFGQTADDVLKRLGEFRRAGVAVARAEVTPGVIGVGAPIFDGGTAPVGSLTIAISEKRMDGSLLARLKDDVRAAAAVVSELVMHHRADAEGEKARSGGLSP